MMGRRMKVAAVSKESVVTFEMRIRTVAYLRVIQEPDRRT